MEGDCWSGVTGVVEGSGTGDCWTGVTAQWKGTAAVASLVQWTRDSWNGVNERQWKG